MRIRNLQPIVKRHLEESVEARNSDNVLYLRVLRELCREKGLDVDNMSVPTLFNNIPALHLPTCESVGRARCVLTTRAEKERVKNVRIKNNFKGSSKER